MTVEDKDKLLKFFSEALSEQEKKEFLEKASSDKDFIREFVRMAELNEAIEKHYGLSSINFKKKRSSFIRYLIVGIPAAAILLLGLFVGIHSYQFNKNPGEQVFKEFYEPYDISFSRTGDFSRSSDAAMDVFQLYSLYLQEDYKSIIQINVQQLFTEEIQESAYILQGISAIEVGNYEKAKFFFQQVDDNSNYATTAEWYLILLAINENNFENSILELNKLAEENLIFREKALDLIKYLQRHKLID